MLTTSHTLLARLRDQHDAQAWDRWWLLWIDVYHPWLRGWLGRHQLQPADVEDVLQNVLVSVRQNLPHFEHNGRPGAFRSWLRRILSNQISLLWRSRKRKAEKAELLDQLEDDNSDLSRQWDEEHNKHLALRMLDFIKPDFDPETLEVFRLRVLEDLPTDEVVRRCGKTAGAVYAIQFRVLARLREMVGDVIES